MNPRSNGRQQLRALFLGGILPVVAYTIIEEKFGLYWGLIAGMVLGVGEILWEWRSQGRVDPLTWGGNGMILVLGGVSLFTQEGYWFKLQPSILEGFMAFAFIGSVLLGRPLLVAMARKQGAFRDDLPEPVRLTMERGMGGLTFRAGIFLLAHALLAAWAAFYWSTLAWGILKGVGFTLSFLVYLVVETLLLRYRISNLKS